ncbi:hypothetical protein D3C72_2035900 [compost metagenome]
MHHDLADLAARHFGQRGGIDDARIDAVGRHAQVPGARCGKRVGDDERGSLGQAVAFDKLQSVALLHQPRGTVGHRRAAPDHAGQAAQVE